jgi:hypothetical protein
MNNVSYKSTFFRDDATGKIPFLVWSEANPKAYRCAADTILKPSVQSGFPGVLLGVRNAVNFHLADFNFAWIGYMSTANNKDTNDGTAYLDDFDWISSRQSDFGLKDLNLASTLQMGAAWPGFNDAVVPVSWNGGTSRFIARNLSSGASTAANSFQKSASYSTAHNTDSTSLFNFRMPWITWNTWNDFPEGTQIEPGPELGLGYVALETAQATAVTFKSIASADANGAAHLRLPYLLYESRLAGSSVAGAVFSMIASRNFDGAAACLSADAQARATMLGWRDIVAQIPESPNVSFALDLMVCVCL